MGRCCPFPGAAGRFLECTKTGLAPGHLEDCGMWRKEKSCPFSSALGMMLLSSLAGWVGDRRAVSDRPLGGVRRPRDARGTRWPWHLQPSCCPWEHREYSFDPVNSQWNRLYGNLDTGLFILAVTSGEQVVWSLCSMCAVRNK